MKQLLIGVTLVLLLSGPVLAQKATLWNKLIDVAIQHIKEDGPDAETGQFISVARHHAWSRRDELVNIVVPHLQGTAPGEVAGAVAVLSWVRSYRPMSYVGDWEKRHHEFLARIDEAVYGQIEHFHSLKSDAVYHRLALFLGSSATGDAKRHLLRIARSPAAKSAKEQALICLAWHRDPKDMDSLLPFMLKESDAAWNLPYHFRNSYGTAALPYLKRALAEAESSTIRQRTAYELVHLRIPEGFRYLRQIALADPEPEDPTRGRALDGIRQFAIDRLGLSRDIRAPAAIAAHLARKEHELCTSRP